MKSPHHAVISAGISGVLYGVFKSPALAVSSFIAGILIDLDHVFDYLVQFGFRFDLKLFFTSFGSDTYRYIFIFLHSWEILTAMWIASWLTGWNHTLLGVTIGFSQHMVLDQIFNEPNRIAYFLTWRICCRFNPSKMFKNYHKDES